jgi:hypothetical protein
MTKGMRNLCETIQGKCNRAYHRFAFDKEKLGCTTVFFFVWVLLLAPVTVQAQTPNTSWYDNDPTAHTFTISTADELAGLADLVNNGNDFDGKTITLENDINLSAYAVGDGWTPIGNSMTNTFSGTLDGRGFKITELYINRVSEDCVGLFGYIITKTNGQDPIVKNLGLVIADGGITGQDNVGGLVGFQHATADGNGNIIEKCYVAGKVTGRDNVGGLVGHMFSNLGAQATIAQCYSTGSVTGRRVVGGIVGLQESANSGASDSRSLIENCYSTCDVSSNEDNGVGGIVGRQGTSTGGECKVRNCYSTGKISTTMLRAGGIVGCQNAYSGGFISVEGCFSIGEVRAAEGYAGGIAGRLEPTGSGVIMNSNNNRYILAEIYDQNTRVPFNDLERKHNERHGANRAAVEFMVRATYTRYAWAFSVTEWQWNAGEFFPVLNMGEETYPFPFYAITYDFSDSDDLSKVPLPVIDYLGSYDPVELAANGSLTPNPPLVVGVDAPKKYKYEYDGWLPAVITASDRGHQVIRVNWKKVLFDVTIDPAITNGSVSATPNDAILPGDPVTLTITPHDGCELESIYVCSLDDPDVLVPLSGTGNTRTFIMPAFDVHVVAVFKDTRLSIEDIQLSGGLKAYVQSNTLYVSGLTTGQPWRVHSTTGVLVNRGIAVGGTAEVALPGRGVYIVTDGTKVLKVSN